MGLLQVSGFEDQDACKPILHHLTNEVAIAESLLTKTKNPNVKGGMIDVNKLLETFQNVPKEFLESDLKSLEPYIKAFLLFLLGTLIFTNGSRSISPQYLQLLEINKIDSYAWGAAAIEKLKESMSNIKKSVRDNDKYSSIYGFSLALSVRSLSSNSY